MSFADPQSVTISGVTTSLPRVSTGIGTGSFKSNDALIGLSVAHSYGKRSRHTIRLDVSKLTADPFLPSSNVKVGTSMYLVFDMPLAGFTVTDEVAIWTGFNTLLTASSSAKITQLLGGEN